MFTRKYLFLLPLLIVVSIAGCSKSESAQKDVPEVSLPTEAAKAHKGKPLVTFVEVGSVKCVPCTMMQPVMKKVEETFGSQVKVIFYDVWTPQGAPYGEKYGVDSIPTQIYLDADGKEYQRHIGFAPFEDVKDILSKKGVK